MMLKRLRIRPEDALLDFREWHRLLWVQLGIFMVHFVLFGGVYFWVEGNVGGEMHDFLLVKLSHFFVIVLFAQVYVIVGYNWPLFKRVLATFLYQSTSPFNLALMRMTLMGILAGHLAVYVPQRLAQVAALPHSSREALPLIGWLIDIMPINPPLYQAMTVIGAVLCLMAALGLWTRFSLIASALALFYVLGVPQFFGKLNHTHFMLWIPAFLAFSPAGDVFSLDALLRRLRGKARIDVRPHYRYGLAMKFVFLQLALVYFFSGVGKLWLGGLEWALSDNLVHLMRLEWLENYGHVPALRVDRYPLLCRVAGVGVVCFELAMPLLVLTPKTRVAAALGAIGFHNVTYYFLNIDFVFLQNIQAFHLDLYKVVNRLLALPRWYWIVPLVLAGYLALNVFSLVLAQVMLLLVLVEALRRRRNAGTEIAGAEGPAAKPHPWLWRVALFILAANTCFGFTQTSSWPFSAYPSYSFVREGFVRYVWFEPRMDSGESGDLNAMAEREGFRKENILSMSERSVNLFLEGKQAEFARYVTRFWLRFREKVPELKAWSAARVLLQTFSTDPDHLDKPLQENILGEMRQVGGEWIFEPTRE